MSSTPIHRLAVLVRLLRRSVAFACVASLLLMGTSANAGPINVLEYTQANPSDTISVVDNGNGTTSVNPTGSIPVEITIYLGASLPPGGILAYETFSNVNSTGAAGQVSNVIIYQSFAGTVSFTSGPGGTGYNYLTAAFSAGTMSSPILSGLGLSAGLAASDPPDNLTFSATNVTFGGTTSMSLSFSGVSPYPPGLTIDNTSVPGSPTISSFTANHTGTFNAEFVTSVPEPGTFFMASIAVVVGTLAYRRKKRMSE